MRARSDFLLRQIADAWVLLPIGSATISLNGMIKLNETGVFLWKLLEQDTTEEVLADALVSEYGITKEDALQDVATFLHTLGKADCIEK